MCTALAWFGHLDLLGCMPSFRFKFHMSAGINVGEVTRILSCSLLIMGLYDSCESFPLTCTTFSKSDKEWIEMA